MRASGSRWSDQVTLCVDAAYIKYIRKIPTTRRLTTPLPPRLELHPRQPTAHAPSRRCFKNAPKMMILGLILKLTNSPKNCFECTVHRENDHPGNQQKINLFCQLPLQSRHADRPLTTTKHTTHVIGKCS
jgi:hypothetical protein